MPYHPQQLPKPCNADFYYFCKREKEINRDSSCVIFSKISTLSTSVVISWKAKRRGAGEGKKKKRSHREAKKWKCFGGVQYASAKEEYLKGDSGLPSWVLRNYGDASSSCWNPNMCNWKRNLPKLPALRFPVLKGDLGARSKTQSRPCNAKHCRAWVLGVLPCRTRVQESKAAGWEPDPPWLESQGAAWGTAWS